LNCPLKILALYRERVSALSIKQNLELKLKEWEQYPMNEQGTMILLFDTPSKIFKSLDIIIIKKQK